MIKKEIFESEIRTSGFKQVQADIAETSGKIDAHRDALKRLEQRRILLIESGKKESAEYKNLNKEIRAVNKSIKDETQVLSAHYSKLSLGAMSYTQLKKRAGELAKELRNTSKAAEPEKYTKLEQELDRVNKQMGKMQVGAKQASGVFKNAVSVFAGNMLTKAVDKLKEWVQAAKDWVNEGTQMAGKAEGVQTAFNKLNDRNLLADLRQATKGTVNDLALMQSAVKAENFKIPLEGLGSLLKFAQQRAQETGESVDYLTESIVNGIGRKSPLILDNLGISAERLRNKTKELGDFSKAAIAIVNEELEKQGDLALTSADKAQQSAVKWENAQLRVGQRLKGFKDTWNEISGEIADGIARIAGDARTATERFDEQIRSVAGLKANIEPLIAEYEELTSRTDQNGKKTELNADEQKRLNEIAQTISKTIPGVITQFDKYGNALAINTTLARAWIETEKARLSVTHAGAISDAAKELSKAEREANRLAAILRRNEEWAQGTEWGLSPTELGKIESQYQDALKAVNGWQAEHRRLTGESLDDQLDHQTKWTENETAFRQMNKEQLDAWIKDTANAGSDYKALAEQIYSQRFGGGGGNGDDDKKTTPWRLNNDNTYQEKRLLLKQQQLSGEIATEKEYKAQLLQLEIDTLTSRIALNKDSADTLLNLNEQLTDKLLEQRKNQTDAELQLNKLIEDSCTDLIAKENEAYRKRLEEYGINLNAMEELTASQKLALEIINREHQQKIDKIENDAIANSIKKMQQDFERRLTLKKTQNNEELAGIQTLAQAKIILREQYGVEELVGIKSLADARARIQKEQNKQIEAETAEHLRAIADQLRRAIDSGTFDGLDIGDAILSDEQKDELKKRLEEIGLSLSELGVKKQEITGGEASYSSMGGNADILGLTPSDWELLFENLKNGKISIAEMVTVAQALSSAFKQYDTFRTASENKQLKQWQKNNDAQKSQLTKRLNAGRMSQEEYNEAIGAMDAELDKKREEIELKQARRRKAQAIIDSIINTAVAVTKVAANPALAIAVGILGAIQTGLIIAQPVSGREEGSFLVEREQDGKVFNAEFAPKKRGTIGKPTVIVGENGNEYVIPADGYENPTLAPIIRTIEDARLRGNLREFDFSNIQPVRLVGHESGGFVNAPQEQGPVNNPAQNPSDGNGVPLITLEVLQKLSKQLDKPLQAIVSILGKNGLKEKMDEYERTREKGRLA